MHRQIREMMGSVVSGVATRLRGRVSPQDRDAATVRLDRSGYFLLLLVPFSVAAWFFVGPFVLASVAAGLGVAYTLRTWNTQHPGDIIDALRAPRAARADINISAISIGGDAGGLTFVVGSVAVIAIGIPGMSWYLLGVVTLGLTTGALIRRWRMMHSTADQALSLRLR